MSYAGADGVVIRSLLRDDIVQGIVLAGTGLGDVSESMFDAIQQARERGIPVVIARGFRRDGYFRLARQGLSTFPKENWVHARRRLSPQKARILLMLALTKTHEPSALRKYFDD